MFRAFVVVLMAGTLMTHFSANAATSTWSGNNGTSWVDPLNWNVVPVAGSDLVFPSSAANHVNTCDFAAGTSFNSITFSGGSVATSYNFTGNSIKLVNGINHTTTLPTAVFINIAITMNTTQNVTVTNAGSQVTLGGVLSGAGGFTKMGPGDVTFGNGTPNTYTGATTVLAGSLTLAPAAIAIPGPLIIGDSTSAPNTAVVTQVTSNAIAAASALTVNASGIYTLNANANTVASLTVNGGSVTLTNVTSTLTLAGDVTTNAAATSSTISGSGKLALGANRMFTVADSGAASDLAISTVISGAFGITKAGPGKLTISSTSTYTGPTTVSAGTLLLTGSLAGPVAVQAGGTFGGNGTMTTLTSTGGTIASFAPGLLTSGSAITFDANTTWNAKLNGTDAATGFDQLATGAGVITLAGKLNGTLNFPSAVGDSFIIVKNDTGAAISGTFAGLPEGAMFSVSGVPFSMSYIGTRSGHDGVITHVSLGSSMALAAQPSTAVPNAPVILTATATAQVGTPSGTITFLDGATVLGTATLVNGVATLVTTTLATGSHSITATYAGDTSFSASNASAVTVTVSTSGGANGAPAATQLGLTDTDSDGFPDALETAFTTSPTTATDTPFAGQPAPSPLPLVDVKLSIKLDFSKKNNDSLSLAGTLLATQGFSPSGQKVGVQVGNAALVFTLDGKGSSKSGSSSIKIAIKGSAAQSAKFSLKASKSSLAANLAPFGLTATAKTTVNVPIFITFNGGVYTILQPETYSGNGKTGTAKNKK